jgi:hypothetical protein
MGAADANVARIGGVEKLAGGGSTIGKQAGHILPGTAIYQIDAPLLGLAPLYLS